MKKINFTLIISFLFLIFSSCNNDKLINNKASRAELESRYTELKKLGTSKCNQVFDEIANTRLNSLEEDAILFLFSSMPLSDFADYPASFFLDNIRSSLRAREDFPWVKLIPEDIYLHYVLPVRVNNENLDSFRLKYYDELKDRISETGDIRSAALEINHWCHEKVSYQGADIRTSSPMATILSARGRCGEESTFTVAALRTVGIPARQVYVPRWSHSDDNHAWVEVWDNGTWTYMGACEPEPILNRGWFTEAASRAMLVHTKSFGKYLGREKQVGYNTHYGEINNLSLYANTKDLVVRVVDKDMQPLEEALVEFKVFNYAEFYTLADLYTDKKGICEFETGLGDLLVWASKGKSYGFEFIRVGESDTIQLLLGNAIEEGSAFLFDHFIPPADRSNPSISEEQHKGNRVRLKEEDRIREAYIAAWIDSSGVANFAEEHHYNYADIHSYITRSQGNYMEILTFLKSIKAEEKGEALSLLNVIADKDLRDTPSSILLDHHSNARNYDKGEYSAEVFNLFVLNPRIANEILTPWRKYLQEALGQDRISEFQEDPAKLSGWISEKIRIDDMWNYYNVPISPQGSLEMELSDKLSRDILFVALCRSIGIPSRLGQGSNSPMYFHDGTWRNISFKASSETDIEKAKLSLSLSGNINSPEYYTHFTLARIINGRCVTLKYDYGKDFSDFSWPIMLQAGDYILFTGNRLSDSEILSEARFFSLQAGEQKTIEFSLREKHLKSEVLFRINPGASIYNGEEQFSISNTGETGSLLAWINHEKEPSKHFLNELRKYKEQFESWSGNIILVSDSSYITESFSLFSDKELPQNTILGFESGSRLLKELIPETDPINPSFPLVLYINKSNEVVYKSEGYRLGLSSQILNYIASNKE